MYGLLITDSRDAISKKHKTQNIKHKTHMTHNNLRDELFQAMEYSKTYKKKQAKIDIITYVMMVLALLLAVIMISL